MQHRRAAGLRRNRGRAGAPRCGGDDRQSACGQGDLGQWSRNLSGRKRDHGALDSRARGSRAVDSCALSSVAHDRAIGGRSIGTALLSGLVAGVLGLGVLLPCLLAWPDPAAALALPWRHRDSAERPLEARPTTSPWQEVAPPEPVQQLQAALATRQPVVEILAPADDTLLPPGPWTLQLRVHDWPLVDGGDLGLGPHLMVQLDQEPPQAWTRTEGTLPELSPGSHRLTVYAAQPWDEARKNPGAWQQIRLHRTAPNPLALPQRGSPQLLAVSPPAEAGDEPLLLDWLLLDAPLQNLRGTGNPWRLRLTLNGEAVILEQQTPLWLRGWRPGPNALQLEWLDERGDPLNPPFNSLVLDVNRPGSRPRPRWLGPRLAPEELAVLLGRTAPAAAVAAPPFPEVAPLQGREPPIGSEPSAALAPEDGNPTIPAFEERNPARATAAAPTPTPSPTQATTPPDEPQQDPSDPDPARDATQAATDSPAVPPSDGGVATPSPAQS